jgi:hypothetical protein
MTHLGVHALLVMKGEDEQVVGLVVSTFDIHRCLGTHWVVIEGYGYKSAYARVLISGASVAKRLRRAGKPCFG